jgi:hypothetical protein
MPVVTNVFEIVAKCTLAETSVVKNIYNVFHYRLLSGVPDTAVAITNAFSAVVSGPTHLEQNWWTTDTTHVSDDGRWIDDATVQYYSNPSGNAGAIALPRLPGDVCCSFLIRGSQRGKNFRGAKRLCPVATAFALKDELSAAGITAAALVNGYISANLTTANGSVMTPFVLSRALSQLRVNPTTIVGSDKLSVLTNKTLGTMRRRREKTVR